jgi:DNA-binding transcriptional LysR family regulator
MSWDEIRTAYQVARLGTVSAAAEALGVHHATVIRHVDALEGQLGVRLFQRHARGYTPTEAGQELLRVAAKADDGFSQLAARIKGQEATGELVVTALPSLVPRLVPVLAEFQDRNPGLTVRLLAAERLFRLESGEAHIAIRAGLEPPAQPDNVVQPLARTRFHLVAAQGYLDRHGRPQGEAELAAHRFVGLDGDGGRAPFNRWLDALAPGRIAFRTSGDPAMVEAICGGAGIGFASVQDSADRPDLREILPHRPDWEVPLWLVTHVDLHRSPKVQAALGLLKGAAKGWTG